MLGIILALIAALLIGIALSYQRIGLKSTEGMGVVRSRHWVFGSVLAAIAFFVYYFALTFEKLSIIQPLINTSIVFTVIFSYIFLREKGSRRELLLILIIFFGVTLLVM